MGFTEIINNTDNYDIIYPLLHIYFICHDK